MIKLNTCPFCGSQAEMEHTETDGFFVICSKSLCGIMTRGYDTEEEAAEAWNRRVIDEIPSMSRMGLVELIKQIYAEFKQKYVDMDLNDEAYQLEIKEILSSFLEYVTKEILDHTTICAKKISSKSTNELRIGEIIYTKSDVCVLDIGLIESLHPFRVYARCSKNSKDTISYYGGASYCNWCGTGILKTYGEWKKLTIDGKDTKEICEILHIPFYVRKELK